MAQYLESNCYLPAKKEKYKTTGMRWQVPWGKHSPVCMTTLMKQIF